jgi:hypothetical protein
MRAAWPAVSRPHAKLPCSQLVTVPPPNPTCRLLVLLVLARFTFNALLRAPTQRLAERRGGEAHHRDGSRLLEELWVTAGNLVMLGTSMYVMLNRQAMGGITCRAGKPGLCPVSRAARRQAAVRVFWQFGDNAVAAVAHCLFSRPGFAFCP